MLPGIKGMFQRSDLAVCLLAEVTYEQGDKIESHIPLLFHICVICMDSPESVVRTHCQQLIINLLNAVISKRAGTSKKTEKVLHIHSLFIF